MIYNKSLVANSIAPQRQLKERDAIRSCFNINENRFSGEMKAHNLKANAGRIPDEVFREFDNVTVERMKLDEGDAFLNDLMTHSRSLPIGKLTFENRRASDAGNVQTSMTGQIGVKFDSVDFSIDGTIIPVHDNGFSRNWREFSAGQSEGFDSLIDDQRENVAAHRNHLADTFMDGHKDKNGQIIVVDTRSWSGMRADPRVAQIDLGVGGVNFDFTDQTQTGDAIKNAFIQLRDTMRITNKISLDLTYYVSEEIASNFERKFSAQYDAKTIEAELMSLRGVAGIKSSSKLGSGAATPGNELMALPMNGLVRPLVGMGTSVIAQPRQVYNANYDFVVASAIGWEVRTDFFNNTSAMLAKD
tara:strand:+ start:286 stop:1362 length:1077 start_codon:yes stop_codon:yes gene_type:complete